ncbi:MAG: site-specific integrase [Oscillospiraceae bacterium]|nr:site-specific integrase [Candidatus Ruminococcus equi]
MPTTGFLAVKNGKYYAVLNLYDCSGKRKPKWISTGYSEKNNKRKAEKLLRDLCVERDNKNVKYYTNIKVHEYFTKWLDEIKTQVRPNTFRGYKGNMENHIIPYFRALNVELQELKPFELSTYYRLKVGTISVTTIKHLHQNISKALSDAVEKGLISTNPATAAKTPKSTENFQSEFLNRSEIKQLIETVKGSPIYIPTFLASVYGLRRSEVLGLKWHNIDFENETIWIRETLQQCTKDITGESNYTSETKTESSNRTLPMTPQVKEVLLKHRNLQKERRVLLGSAYHINDYVCTFDNGKEISPNYLSRTFHKTIEKTDLPMIRFHDLRHSVASNLLNDGFTVVQVAQWLGHSSSSTTLKFYAHIDKTSKMAIANSLAPI